MQQQQYGFARTDEKLDTAKSSEKSIGKSYNVEFPSKLSHLISPKSISKKHTKICLRSKLFGAKLDDAAKVCLLLRKLNTVIPNKYTIFILPKHARDLSFKENITKLTELFGTQTSQFNIKYNCLHQNKIQKIFFLRFPLIRLLAKTPKSK